MVSKEKTNEYLIFKVLEQEFAIDLDQSREILEMKNLTPVPDSPEYISGIIKVRDQIIPIVDLAKKMNLKSETDKNKVIIISMQDVLIGLLVEEIIEIKKVDKINKSDVLKSSQKVDRAFIEGILTLNEKLVIVIDTKKLFDNFNLEMALD